jgi:hypothetical protein
MKTEEHAVVAKAQVVAGALAILVPAKPGHKGDFPRA